MRGGGLRPKADPGRLSRVEIYLFCYNLLLTQQIQNIAITRVVYYGPIALKRHKYNYLYLYFTDYF